MKITVIGSGNMGGALALGLAASGVVNASDITVTAAHAGTLARFSEKGIKVSLDNALAAKDADIVFLAVKPWVFPSVLEQIGPVAGGSLVVCVSPAVKSSELKSSLPAGARIAYVIPNTAIEVRQSMSFIANVSAGPEDIVILEKLLSAVGEVMVVDEAHLGACTALASCGIAYALRYIRAAAEGGVEMGMYAGDATRVVAQTVRGAAALLQAHGSHPEEEIDKVTTPGGLTIKGLNAMEAAGFTDAVIRGLKAGK